MFEKKPLRKKMMGGVPQPLRAMGAAAVVIFGGMLGLSLASSVTVRAIRAAADAKRVRDASFSLYSYICT